MDLNREILFAANDAGKYAEALQQLFPEPDWIIHQANTVKQAKQSFADNYHISIVVCGFSFSDGNGKELLTFVRNHDSHVQIIFFSDGDKDFSALDVKNFTASSYVLEGNKILNGFENLDQMSTEVHRAFTNHMRKLCAPKINSEFGALKSVLVHTPGAEMERIDPEDLEWHLFESRPELSHMRDQHNEFIRTIKTYGNRPLVLETALLLYDIVKNAGKEERVDIIEHILFVSDYLVLKQKFENHNITLSPVLHEKVKHICECEPKEIVNFLLCGLNILDFSPEITDSSLLTNKSAQIVKPVPNLYFQRDPSFVLGDNIFISRMFWPIRQREPKIIRKIIQYHPFMKYAKSHTVDKELGVGPQLFSIEGGDVMAIDRGVYAITDSERTNRQGVMQIAKKLLLHSGAEKVYVPMIPPKRAFIHLDTVCSLAGPNHVVVHPKAMEAYGDTLVWTANAIKSGREPTSLKKNFVDVLKDDLGKTIIETAGGGARADLEQFDDATNVFMLNSEVAVAYDRNRETNKAMQENGITIAEFPGSDLVMGRGGARCMTMPLRRD